MIKLEYLTDTNSKEWNFFVSSNLSSKVYHTAFWKKHIQDTFKYTPLYILVKNSDEIIAIAPFFLIKSIIFGNRLVSLPFTDYGGFCFKKDIDARVLKEILSLFYWELHKVACKASLRCIEIRGWDRSYDFFLPDFKKKFVFPFINFKLDLALGHKYLFARYRRNIRRHLVKINHSLIIKECLNIEELKKIFNIYSLEIRKFGSPPLPWRYFLSEWENLRRQNFFFAFSAEVNSNIVGGITILCDRSQVYAEHITSLPEYDHLYIKEKLYDYTIDWASKCGYKFYNFCRCRKNSGVYYHKKGWRGKEEEIVYLYEILRKEDTYLAIEYSQRRFDLFKWILRRIPVSLLRIIGLLMRREIGQ